MTYQSNLVPIAEAVNNSKTLQELKEVLNHHITDNKKFGKDEGKMLYAVSKLRSHTQGLFFFYNNILKYEKLGVA